MTGAVADCCGHCCRCSAHHSHRSVRSIRSDPTYSASPRLASPLVVPSPMSNIHGLSSKRSEKKENEEEYSQGAAGQR